jgi:transcriptional regulator with XRE-family HTH domain
MKKKFGFGLRLKALRRRRGITQERLAEKIDRSVDAISNIERGISLPNYDTLTRLSNILGTPMSELSSWLGPDALDTERAEMEVVLADLARTLDKVRLRIAVEQVRVLAKYGLST